MNVVNYFFILVKSLSHSLSLSIGFCESDSMEFFVSSNSKQTISKLSFSTTLLRKQNRKERTKKKVVWIIWFSFNFNKCWLTCLDVYLEWRVKAMGKINKAKRSERSERRIMKMGFDVLSQNKPFRCNKLIKYVYMSEKMKRKSSTQHTHAPNTRKINSSNTTEATEERHIMQFGCRVRVVCLDYFRFLVCVFVSPLWLLDILCAHN